MSNSEIKIQTAFFSVTDKTGLKEFAVELLNINPTMTIIASGGTAKVLEEAGVSVTSVASYTGFPECFDGRVKTLHPNIAGGILFKRGEHDDQAKELGISAIDLVVCNLYQFQQAFENKDISFDKLMDFIDIGGSCLIRSSVKNHAFVSVVTTPSDYGAILDEMRSCNGKISLKTRKNLAVKAINLSANYESLIACALSNQNDQKSVLRPYLREGKKLRYGENPDQEAWVYEIEGTLGIAQAQLVSGKPLSYNNYEDASVAYRAAQELTKLGALHGASVVKHGSLCGFATAASIQEAFQKAWQGDSKSAFGSVIALSSIAEASLIEEFKGKFIEVIIAPEFSKELIEWAKSERPNLRLLCSPENAKAPLMYKNISGGMLVQTQKHLKAVQVKDLLKPSEDLLKPFGVVTKKLPEKEKFGLYAFAIASVNFVKSNGSVIVREWKEGFYQLIGVGSGQPNRVDSLHRLAIPKAVETLKEQMHHIKEYDPKEDLKGCVLATDGFFPFDDSIRYAAECGIKHCVQPGGSKKDKEVIQTADELDLCMVFTQERYFTH